MFAHTLALGMPGLPELLVIGGIGLLVFGKRLPEVGRGLGQAIMQFKKGLHEASEEVSAVDVDLDRRPALTNQVQTPVISTPVISTPVISTPVVSAPIETKPSTYKFDPFTGKPVENAAPVEADATASTH